jgi:hypothetical protein
MDCAQQQATARELTSYSGNKNLQKFILSSFSNDEIVHMAKKIVVSLGATSSQISSSMRRSMSFIER